MIRIETPIMVFKKNDSAIYEDDDSEIPKITHKTTKKKHSSI